MHTDKGERMVASGRSRGGSPVGERRVTVADGGTPTSFSDGLAARFDERGEGKERGGQGLYRGGAWVAG